MKTYFIKTRKADFVSQIMNNIDSPTNVSPLLHGRHRLASCSNQTKPIRPHYLHMVTNASNYRMKANSLPSILDSDNDADHGIEKENTNKSPTSTASYGKKKSGRKPWKYLQRQRTAEEMTPLETENKRSVTLIEANQGIMVAASSAEANGFHRASNEVES